MGKEINCLSWAGLFLKGAQEALYASIENFRESDHSVNKVSHVKQSNEMSKILDICLEISGRDS